MFESIMFNQLGDVVHTETNINLKDLINVAYMTLKNRESIIDFLVIDEKKTLYWFGRRADLELTYDEIQALVDLGRSKTNL